MYRPSNAVQPSNAPVSILSSFSGRLTLTSPSQYAKASYPILVRFFEKYIDFRELQPLNEVSPIVVTLSGMVIASRLPQYPKAPLISSRPAGNDIVFKFQQNWNVPSFNSVIFFGRVTLSSFPHP